MMRKNNEKAFAFFVIVTVLLFSGCSRSNNKLDVSNTMPEQTNSMPELGIVELTPSELFDDNLKKLEPHLGIISGCVHIKYSGPKNHLSTKYEIWENGEIVESKGSMGVSFGDVLDSDFSISLKNVSHDNEEEIFRLTTVIHKIGSTSHIDKDIKIPKFTKHLGRAIARAPRAIREIKQISDEEEIAVWAYTAAESFRSGGTIQDAVQKAKWAFVYKIKFSDLEEKESN